MKLENSIFKNIREVSKEIGEEPHVLRYWEKTFKEINIVKAPNGRRLYRQTDINLIKEIKSLFRDEGFTTRGVKQILQKQQNELQKLQENNKI